MAKVLLEYEANIDGLRAALKEIDNANVQISDSAANAAKSVTDEYKRTSQAAKNAFAGQEVKKAIDQQAKSVDTLANELEVLYNEQVRLLQQNKQNTQEYQKNAKALDATRVQFDKLNGIVKQLNTELPKTAQEVAQLEDELRKLALEGKAGTEEFDNIARAIGEYKAAITEADRAVDLYAKSTDAASSRVGELEDKLFDLKLRGEENTQEFKDTIAEVTRLKRAIFEVDQQVDSYVERSRGIATVVQNVELVANAFQVAEGAAAIFGDNSEELQEALVKLNALLAITNGLSQVRTILLDQEAKKTGLLGIAQRAYALAVGTSTGALKAFRLALATTGVGLLVVGLGVLIGKLTETKEETEDLTKANEDLQRSYDNLQKGVQSAAARLNKARIEQLVLEGKLSEETAERIKLQIDANEEISKVNEDASKKETERLELFRKQVKENANLEKIEKKLLAEDLNTIERERATLEAAIRLELANKIKQLNKEQSKETASRVTFEISELKRLEAAQENAAKALSGRLIDIDERTNEELAQERVTFLRRVIAEGDNSLQARINLINAEATAEKEGIKERLGFTQDALNRIAIVEAEARSKISDLIKDNTNEVVEDTERLTREALAQINQIADAIQQSFNSIADLARDVTQRRIDQIERVRDAELDANSQLQQSYADRVRNDEAITLRASRRITEEKRKQARLDKALGIFNATIDTAQAIIGFLKDPGGVAGVILSVAAGITGATQVAKIASEPLPTFGKGGWIDGKPHSSGGVNINAEGGEFVTNKRSAMLHSKELEAMNKGRSEFLKLIEEQYVRPRVLEVLGTKKDAMSVNVNASLNSYAMEGELVALRRETKKTGKVISKALQYSHSNRYTW